jgi:hypothetical protein
VTERDEFIIKVIRVMIKLNKGVVIGPSVISNSIPHPCLSNERLSVVPDPVHIYINIAAALTKGYTFVLGDSIVKKHKLQYNIVSIEPIKGLYQLEKDDVVKLCPHLKEKVIRPIHFDKMNVSLSTALH